MTRGVTVATLLTLLAAATAWAQSDKEKPLPPVPKATIAVSSTPSGARVYVGSEGGGAGMYHKGVSPVTVTIHTAQEEAPQRYRVTVVLPGYDTYTRVLEVRRGDALQLDASLDPQVKRCYVADGAIVVEAWQGGERKVIAPAGLDFSYERIAWSPSGKHIAYARMGELFTADLSWRRERQVTNIGGEVAGGARSGVWAYESPTWGSDGRRLFSILRSPDQGELMCVPVRLTPADELPGGSGDELAGEGLGLASEGPQVETPQLIGSGFACIDDAQSGGGRRLAAQTSPLFTGPVLYSDLMLIALGPEWTPLPDAPRVTNGAQAAWSPDGTRLVFTCYDPMARTGSLWLADGAGNGAGALFERALARVRTPAWSPDGERLVFLLEESDGARRSCSVWELPLVNPSAAREVWRSSEAGGDSPSARLLGFTPDGREVVLAQGSPDASRIRAVSLQARTVRDVLPMACGAFTYSSGTPAMVYRSLETFRSHLLAALEGLDVGRLSELCLPVLEKNDATGKLVKEVWEDDRAAALAEILRNAGPTGVTTAAQVPYAGSDARFEQVLRLGGAGRQLFLLRSDGRWYVGGFHLGGK